jgi:2-polyprenyl-3-methyl-5-hydroxy-6-metoxy-1,4-benzoquinol methylase
VITGWQTAIRRFKLSRPLAWLITHDYVQSSDTKIRILDFGCGRGLDASIIGAELFDPYWHPKELESEVYDIVLCIYVLCILNQTEREKVIKKVIDCLKFGGTAYFAVRRDIKMPTKGKNCTQWPVYLDYPIVEQNNNFCIYQVVKSVETMC